MDDFEIIESRSTMSIPFNGGRLRVDKDMAHLIELLRSSGTETLSCCSGHGRYPMSIVIRRYGCVEELISGVILPRKKKFYKRDDEGFFYIPEALTGRRG